MDSMLVIGDSQRIQDFQARTHHLDQDFTWLEDTTEMPDLQDFSVIFDLSLDENPDRLSLYASLNNTLIFGGAVKHALAEMVYRVRGNISCLLVGMNGLPFFLTKDKWELSSWSQEAKEAAEALLKKWDIACHFVEDRVGMVTPRIISMIVNEACYTVQEGTADKEGINQAMRLGVNYPGGPFEWMEKIGARHIYEVLLRIGEDTRDGRYKIAPLLKRMHLESN